VKSKNNFLSCRNNWDSNKQGEEEQLDIVFVHVREGAAKQTNLQGLSEQSQTYYHFSTKQGSHNVLPSNQLFDI